MSTGGGLTTQHAYRQLHKASRRLGQDLHKTARYVIHHRKVPEY